VRLRLLRIGTREIASGIMGVEKAAGRGGMGEKVDDG